MALSLACLLVACSFSDKQQHCADSTTDCEPGESCYKGFCVRNDDSSSSSDPDTEAGRGGKAGSSGTGSMSNANTGAGKGGTGGRAAAGSGGSKAGGVSTGPCTDGEEQACLIDESNTTANEMCNRGMQRCSGKKWGECTGEPIASTETCNGLDDDCDGTVDEQIAPEECFPDGEVGCTRGSDGGYNCEGLCAFGTRSCTDGKLGECTGFKAPETEVCSAAGQPSADENCDGMIDETCGCNAGEMRTCYNGASGTLNMGKCVAGTQTCSNGVLGACMNAVLPSAETCANTGVDDNCDGMVDNIPRLGEDCVVQANMGQCRAGLLQCVAGSAQPQCVATLTPTAEVCNSRDDDCNGKVDDGFDLLTDVNNCGACNTKCAATETCKAGQCAPRGGSGGAGAPAGGAGAPAGGAGAPAAGAPAAGAPAAGAPAAGAPAAGAPGGCTPACTDGLTCCGGKCVDTVNDLNNCGACNTVCSATGMAACCNSKCADLVSNNNCGACGKDCSLLLSGGVTCSCSKGDDGTIGCRGPVLNLCL